MNTHGQSLLKFWKVSSTFGDRRTDKVFGFQDTGCLGSHSSTVSEGKTAETGLTEFWRVKELRLKQGLTLEELAQRSRLTKSYLSKVERGLSVPSIATALKLAEVFGVEVGQLFGANRSEQDFVLVRREERKPFGQQIEGQSQVESLSPGVMRGELEAFVVRPSHQPGSKKPVEHKGYELLFVLDGRVGVELPTRMLELEKGDSLQFLASIPHRLRTLGEKTAEVLVVISNTPV